MNYKAVKKKRIQKALFIVVSALVIICMICLTVKEGKTSKQEMLNTLRGNDPLLQNIIKKQETETVELDLNYKLVDDKSIYDLKNAGNLSVFLLDILPDDKYSIIDLEHPEIANEIKLPVIMQEGNKNGTARIGGFGYSSTSSNATIEIKGNPKENRKYHNFKIRLKDSASRHEGQSIINLKKAYGKPCKIEEKFAFDLFASLDEMMSLRTKFVQVYVKNEQSYSGDYENYGLYILVEQPDENYFINRDLDSSANMYQAENFDFTADKALLEIDDPNYSKKDFEEILDIKQGESHVALIDMIEAVNDENQDIDSIIEQHFDRDNIFAYMAMNVILGNEDMTTNGFMLYKPLLSTVWFVMPSNMSETMLCALDEQRYGVIDSGLSQFDGNLLYERILSKQENVTELIDKIDSLMERIDKNMVTSLTNQYITVLAEQLKVNPDRGIIKNSPEQIITGVQNYYAIMQKNVEQFKKNLNAPQKVVLENAQSNPETVSLKWEDAKTIIKQELNYTIEIAEDADFNNIVYVVDFIKDNNVNIPKGALPKGAKRFYWRVIATNMQGLSSGSANILKTNDDKIVYGAASFAVII